MSMPNLRTPVSWMWEFLALKVKFVADDSGNGVALPLTASFACDTLSVE